MKAEECKEKSFGQLLAEAKELVSNWAPVHIEAERGIFFPAKYLR